MQVALDLAARGQGYVEPNPMVGCVLVKDNQMIGQGYHESFGGPHAEVQALHSLPDQSAAKDATAYVTLEPCCHHGKTPPCTDALISARVSRVVIAMKDPFAEVSGQGIQQLHDAGIETRIGVLHDQATQLNAPYLKRLREDKPFVIAKWAMTLDGKIATVSGESQWITGVRSREEVHRLRARVDAIIVGVGTALRDNPRLTARPPGPRAAKRIVFCDQRLPATDNNLIQSIDQSPVMFVVTPRVDEPALRNFVASGIEVLRCSQRDQMVPELLKNLAKSDTTNVMLEGGGELLSSFFAAEEVDECHVYLGAKTFGGSSAPGPNWRSRHQIFGGRDALATSISAAK